MKKTRLNEVHKALKAKMVEFADYEMPIQYPEGIIHEHNIVRNKVGVFDVSHMGEFEIEGKDALAYVQKMTVNDASKLKPGDIQYSAMCYNDGGIVDDLLVYNLGDNKYMFVVNASNIDKDFDWCKENKEGFDIDLKNISDDITLLAVQGPDSREVLQPLTDEDLSEDALPFYNFKEGKLAGADMIISRTGYTGELGYELYFKGDEETARRVWNKIFEQGESKGIEPVGLGARDTLRLEKGFNLYGNDIDKDHNTIQARMGWATKVDKDADFNGKEAIIKVKEEKPQEVLRGFIINADRFVPRKGYQIMKDGKEIGYVTSGNMSPTLGKPIAMGYVQRPYRDFGNEVEIIARGNRKASAEIVKPPFIK